MKKLLLFLLISTISYAAIEESNEYDNVSLEVSKVSSKTITKPTSHPPKPTRTTTHKINTHKIDTHKIDTHKIDTHKIDTHKIDTHKIDTHKIDTHKIDTHKIDTHKIITHKIDTTHVKHIIDKLNGKHPFEDIRNRIKELQKHIKKNKLSTKEIQRHFTGKPLNIFQKLSKVAQNGIHWLKTHGFWDPLMNVVKTVGRVAANSLCSAFLSSAICEPAVGFVFDAFIDKL
jgi:membrane-associated HD superfamily phosphohydrolase